MGSAKTIIDSFKGKSVVIIGDAVADQFLSGTITRVSREAPVFIMRHDETVTRAGGAANAAVNIAALGGNATLISVVGSDPAGDLLLGELRDKGVDIGGVIADGAISTTTKVRVLAGQQYAPRHQVIRIDHENSAAISSELRRRLLSSLENAAADAIVISDYNYGVADPSIFERAKAIADSRQIPLLIDSRFRLSEFYGATSATPNQLCERLRDELGYQSLLVTCGSRGMRLYRAGGTEVFAAIGSDTAVDVTGAGDTVIAAYALGLASGLGVVEAARIANHAGGIVVMKKGTAAVTADELETSLANDTQENAASI
jgi:bifunctional ADP-heptose synthase (sugar kinase/adenylyltransferase)